MTLHEAHLCSHRHPIPPPQFHRWGTAILTLHSAIMIRVIVRQFDSIGVSFLCALRYDISTALHTVFKPGSVGEHTTLFAHVALRLHLCLSSNAQSVQTSKSEAAQHAAASDPIVMRRFMQCGYLFQAKVKGPCQCHEHPHRTQSSIDIDYSRFMGGMT